MFLSNIFFYSIYFFLQVTASAWLNDLRNQIEQTRILSTVYRSASALGSRLPSIASAKAKVAGAGAILRPVSNGTQVAFCLSNVILLRTIFFSFLNLLVRNRILCLVFIVSCDILVIEAINLVIWWLKPIFLFYLIIWLVVKLSNFTGCYEKSPEHGSSSMDSSFP